MPPCAEECGGERCGAGGGELQPAQAWTEHEDLDRLTSSPGESRRLLAAPPPPVKSKVQAGLTLTPIVGRARSNRKVTQIYLGKAKPKVKTKFQKRKEKFLNVLRPPYFILCVIVIIVCIQVVVWRFQLSWLVSQLEWRPGALLRQPWRLVSYSLVHSDTLHHLALNALVALVVGWCLEREQCWWRVAVVWGGGVAGGALGAASLQPLVRMVGASAGVYALLTAHLPNVALRYGHIPLWWFRPLSVVVLCTSEGVWTLLNESSQGVGVGAGAHRSSLAGEGVAWSAHAGGAFVGITLGLLVFAGENRCKFSVVLGRLAAGVLLVAAALTACACSYYNSDFWTKTEDLRLSRGV